MRNTNKKGFTIVELVVVVAVIAILAAVLIPTFSGIIAKANQSADIQAVRNMNVALASANKTPDNIIDAAAILSEAGFNTEKGLTPAYKGHAFYWFKPTNQVVYVDETDGKFELLFPEKVEGFPAAKNDDCQPLAAAIAGVVNVPVVSETTVGVASSYATTIDIPETVTDFNTLVEWINNDGCKNEKMYTTINNSKTLGIALSGGDIKLTENIVVGQNNGDNMRFHIVEDTTIDLNGFTITQVPGNGASGYALFCVQAGATLNIIDSSKDKTGIIEAPVIALQVNSGGTANLFGGTIKAADDRSATDINDNEVWCVGMFGGTFNMYGGTIDATCDDVDNDFAINGWEISTSSCNLYSGKIVGEIASENCGTVINYGVEIVEIK